MKKDAMGTLKQLSAMGYKNVEHANYVNRKFYGWEAAEFKNILDDLGMKMPSGHTVLGRNHWDESKKDFTDDWKNTVEDAAIAGQKFVISPWLDEKIWSNYDLLVTWMDIFSKCGALCKQSGMQFGYHNHDFEFSEKVKDEILFDFMLANTDPETVFIQLDFGNLYNGGATATAVLKKWPGRFPSVHVKDMIEGDGQGDHKFESTILGKGIVGVKEVVDLCKDEGGTTDFIIEQESYQGKTPLACVEKDLSIMKQWGY
jgi:sugar phosphate isomerase/epimerase